MDSFLKKIFSVLLIASIAFSLIHCSDKKEDKKDTTQNTSGVTDPSKKTPEDDTNPNKPSVDPANEDLLTNVILPETFIEGFKNDKSEFSADEKLLIDQIINKKPISFSLITKLFVAKQIRIYDQVKDYLKITDPTPSLNDFMTKLFEIEKKISEKNDLNVMKVQMEDAIGGIKFYNKDYVSMLNVVLQQKLQCSSGTATYETLNRIHLGAKDFIGKNRVVILTCGHILSGYLFKYTEDGDWILNGIESTFKGKAKVSYGPVKDLNRPMRIIDSNLWMIMDIFAAKMKDWGNIATIGKEVLEITNSMYDNQIPIDKLEEKVKKCPDYDSEGGGGGEDTPDTEISFGGFGEAQVMAGDQQRATVEELLETNDTTGSTYESDGAQSAQPPPNNEKELPKEEPTLEDFFTTTSNGRWPGDIVASEHDEDCMQIMNLMQGEWKLIDIGYEGYVFSGKTMTKTNSIINDRAYPSDLTPICVLEGRTKLTCNDVIGEKWDVTSGKNMRYISLTFNYLGFNNDLCILRNDSASVDDKEDLKKLAANIFIGIKLDTNPENSFYPMSRLDYSETSTTIIGTAAFQR